jgi:hypothetical protein
MKILLTLFVLSCAACSCVSADAQRRDQASATPTPTITSAPSLAAPAAAPEARVQAAWQKVFLDDLAKRPAGSDLRALFSDGGWGNEGQKALLLEPARALLFAVEPNRRDNLLPSPQQPSKITLDALLAATSTADALEDKVTPAMDALEYEYLHATKTKGGETRVIRRVRFNLFDAGTPAAYTALREAFRK